MAAAESRALALVGQREQSPAEQYTEEEWQAFKATLGGNISDAQFRVFRAACRRYGLDPIQRQIQCWKGEGGGLVIYAGIDGLRVVSGRSKNVAAEYGPQWCGKDGVWRSEWIADDPPAGARFGIKLRDQEEVIWGFARFKSYNKGNGTWGKYPEVMLAKVAETLCRRRATPNETSGLYVDAELHAVRDQEAEEYETARVTVVEATATVYEEPPPVALPQPQTIEERYEAERPQRDAIAAAAQRSVDAAAKSNGKPAPEPKYTQDGRPANWSTLRLYAKGIGVATQQDWEDCLSDATGKIDPKKMTAEDFRKAVPYFEQMAAKNAMAEVKVTGSRPEPGEPDDVTFDEVQDEGDPDLLTKLPTGAGVH